MASQSKTARLDLTQLRQRLVRARSQHSDNPAITKCINRLLCRLYTIRESRDTRQDQRILRAAEKALRETRWAI
jgi:hypothetical protein